MNRFDYEKYELDHHNPNSGLPFDIDSVEIKGRRENVRLHWHDRMEVIYIREGSCVISIDCRVITAGAGTVIPIMPGELHAICCGREGYVRLEIFCFPLDILEFRAGDEWLAENVIKPLRCRTFRMPRPICPGSPLHGLVSAPLESASLAIRYMHPGYSMTLRSSLFSFLRALYLAREAQCAPEQDSDDASGDSYADLEIMLDYITEHYGEKLTLEDAAAACGYSAPYFSKRFKEVTGQTFVFYLKEYRLNCAVRRICATNEAAESIAAHCGFDNYSYFSKMFKEKYGVSPAAYRKSLRNNIPPEDPTDRESG